MTTINIGVVGAGFVGGAIIRAFSGYQPIHVYDLGKKIGSLDEVVENAKVIFVCLPTPENADGTCNTDIVRGALLDIDHLVTAKGLAHKEVIIKSTCHPLFFQEMQKQLKSIELLYMPEFLTARTADLDFINSNRFIIGAESGAALARPGHAYLLFRYRFPGAPIHFMTWEEAAMVKYVTNNFFVTKVSFFNEVHEMCEMLNIDSNKVIGEVLNDGRIGRSHFQVPGPDGKLGFGGACFPKDSSAFVKLAEELGCHADIVKAAKKVNKRVRDKAPQT